MNTDLNLNYTFELSQIRTIRIKDLLVWSIANFKKSVCPCFCLFIYLLFCLLPVSFFPYLSFPLTSLLWKVCSCSLLFYIFKLRILRFKRNINNKKTQYEHTKFFFYIPSWSVSLSAKNLNFSCFPVRMALLRFVKENCKKSSFSLVGPLRGGVGVVGG